MEPNLLSWRRIAGLALVALLVVVAGCSDDDEPTARPASALDQIRQATDAAGSAAFSGETRFADGGSGPIDGRSQSEPPAGEVTFPVLADGAPAEVTVTWVDGNIYVQRAVTADLTAVSATLRLEEDAPWTRAIYQSLSTTVFDAYDPFRLLERLSALDVVASPDGTETVGEDELERYVVDTSGVTVAPGGARRIELLTDDQQRLRVVRLEGDQRIEYAISEFGVEVAPTPPPEDQIGGSTARPSVEPVGPFEVVGQGTSSGVTWQLLRAPGTEGGSCWRLETDVPLDPVATTQADGITCIYPFDPTASADEQVQVVVDSGSDSPVDVVVAAVAPGSTAARMRFMDGTAQQLEIDPAGFVLWIGPKAPLAVVLQVTAPDGEDVSCGPGSVSALDDLDVLPPNELAALDRAPWLCVAL